MMVSKRKLFDVLVFFFYFNVFPSMKRVRHKSDKYKAGYDTLGYAGSRLGARQGMILRVLVLPHLIPPFTLLNSLNLIGSP